MHKAAIKLASGVHVAWGDSGSGVQDDYYIAAVLILVPEMQVCMKT